MNKLPYSYSHTCCLASLNCIEASRIGVTTTTGLKRLALTCFDTVVESLDKGTEIIVIKALLRRKSIPYLSRINYDSLVSITVAKLRKNRNYNELASSSHFRVNALLGSSETGRF